MHHRRGTRSPDRSTQIACLLAGWLAGLAMGALLGVLLAPHRGDITRRRLVRRAGEARDQVREVVDDLREGRSSRRNAEEEEEEELEG
ncbi:MAG: YtxH domain-containing protein [Candidatus Latescibacterota bacterium]